MLSAAVVAAAAAAAAINQLLPARQCAGLRKHSYDATMCVAPRSMINSFQRPYCARTTGNTPSTAAVPTDRS